MFPVVERAVDFALDLQEPDGELLWSLEPDDSPHRYALLTGSSSSAFSLRCATGLAEVWGRDARSGNWRPAGSPTPSPTDPTRSSPRNHGRWTGTTRCCAAPSPAPPDDPGSRSATGSSPTTAAACAASLTKPWITAAETAECALAHLAVGERQKSEWLLESTRELRDDDGSYWTGVVLPENVHFPADERSTYTAAAVVLADDAMKEESTAWDVFVSDEQLPPYAAGSERRPGPANSRSSGAGPADCPGR